MYVAHITLAAFAVTLAAGCAGTADPSDVESQAATTTATTPKSEGTALALEEAERNLDVGRDVAGSNAKLDAVLADPATTPDQRDQARIAKSRAFEATGDKEGAIAAVEALLAEHPDGARFPLEEVAEARLRALLTGTASGPPRSAAPEPPAAPFARALAKYFPTKSSGGAPVQVRMLMFGGTEETSNRLGTFAIGRAIREIRREACPLCDDQISIDSSSGRTSWVGIPRSRASSRAHELAVYYFDLEGGRIPARYDAELPLPSAEIASKLEHGDGLIAVRERDGGPPAVLLAAPREAQLAEVEEALAAMKTIPTEPVVVSLNKTSLYPSEIQAVVRASFSGFRACYEARLKSDPTAEGRSRLHFVIRNDGSMDGLTVDTDAGLQSADFDACMASAARSLVFPATHGQKPITVTYPIAFNP